MQFPVSSGQHHRATESEWVPVSPKKPDPPAPPPKEVKKSAPIPAKQLSQAFYTIPTEELPPPTPAQPPAEPDTVFPEVVKTVVSLWGNSFFFTEILNGLLCRRDWMCRVSSLRGSMP